MALGYSSLVRCHDRAVGSVMLNSVIVRVYPTSQERCSMANIFITFGERRN